jgi:hypothetical protein
MSGRLRRSVIVGSQEFGSTSSQLRCASGRCKMGSGSLENGRGRVLFSWGWLWGALEGFQNGDR